MEPKEPTAKSRRHMQICGLAVICLFSAICIWYVVRSSSRSSAVNPQAAGPAAVTAPPDVKIPAAPPKQESDSQVEPLLARLRKSPDDPVLLAEIGKVYFQRRLFPKAAKYYEDSVKIKPDAVVLVKLGGAYHYSGDDERAIGAWNQALRLDPDNPDALFNVGFVKWRSQRNAKEAIAAWQKLLKANPNHPKRAQVEELIAQAKQHLEIPKAGND